VHPEEFLSASTPSAATLPWELARRLPAWRRLQLACAWSDATCKLQAAGIRGRHPEYSAEQVRLALLRLSLGAELFGLVCPGVDVLP
jgi:hypothetical protein